MAAPGQGHRWLMFHRSRLIKENIPNYPFDKAEIYPMNKKRDRPAKEIEITPEMVQVGLAAFREAAADDYCQLSSPEDVLGAVFRAMFGVSRCRARSQRHPNQL